jgi:hypothetical protein
MKKFALISVAAAIAFSAFSAGAADWESIEKLSGSQVYIDRSTLTGGQAGKQDGDKRKVITLISYDTQQISVTGSKFYSMSFVDVFSCRNRTRTTLASAQYAGKVGVGKVVGSHKMDALIPENIKPGTVDEMILAEANCNLMTGKW